jgi:hypothetical protein
MHFNREGGTEPMITKRMIGITLALFGLVIIGGTLGVDLIEAGKWSGLGPAQQLAIVVGLGVAFVGITLIPLGNRPA